MEEDRKAYLREVIGRRCSILLHDVIDAAEPAKEASPEERELIFYFRTLALSRDGGRWADSATEEAIAYIDAIVKNESERNALDLEEVGLSWPIAFTDTVRTYYSGGWPAGFQERFVKGLLQDEAPDVAAAYLEQEAAAARDSAREGAVRVDASPQPQFVNVSAPGYPGILDTRTAICRDVPLAFDGRPAHIETAIYYQRLAPWDRAACGVIVCALLHVRTVERSPLVAAAMAWKRVHDLTREDPLADRLLARIVRAALAEAAHKDIFGFAARADAAADELSAALRKALIAMQEECGLLVGPPSTNDDAIAEQDGALLWDARLASFLSGPMFGKEGAATAESILDTSRKRAKQYRTSGHRWRTWTVDYYFAECIAWALWADRVGERLHRDLTTPPPALQISMFENTIRVASPASTVASDHIRLYGGPSIYFGSAQPQEDVATFDAEMMQRVYQGSKYLQTVRGLEVLLYLVQLGHHQSRVERLARPHIKEYDGGYKAWCEELGWSHKGAAQAELRCIAWALRTLTFPIPGSEMGGNLIILRENLRAHRGVRSRVEIEMSAPLMPDFVTRLPDGEDKRLVPLTSGPARFVGRDQDRAPQLVLWHLLVAEMRKHITELVSPDGEVRGIPLRPAVRGLLGKARVRPELEDELVQLWTTEASAAPALLDVVSPEGGGRVVVSEAKPRAFLVDAGKRAHEEKKRRAAGAVASKVGQSAPKRGRGRRT